MTLNSFPFVEVAQLERNLALIKLRLHVLSIQDKKIFNAMLVITHVDPVKILIKTV
jgi:hypothetical protein